MYSLHIPGCSKMWESASTIFAMEVPPVLSAAFR